MSTGPWLAPGPLVLRSFPVPCPGLAVHGSISRELPNLARSFGLLFFDGRGFFLGSDVPSAEHGVAAGVKTEGQFSFRAAVEALITL